MLDQALTPVLCVVLQTKVVLLALRPTCSSSAFVASGHRLRCVQHVWMSRMLWGCTMLKRSPFCRAWIAAWHCWRDILDLKAECFPFSNDINHWNGYCHQLWVPASAMWFKDSCNIGKVWRQRCFKWREVQEIKALIGGAMALQGNKMRFTSYCGEHPSQSSAWCQL